MTFYNGHYDIYRLFREAGHSHKRSNQKIRKVLYQRELRRRKALEILSKLSNRGQAF
jgi:hypothetical protein